jgi:hypothetical protein
MRTVIQRVSQASVTIDGIEKSRIGWGLLILLGIEHEDGEEDIQWLCKKIAALRIFSDDAGLMNLSVQDIQGAMIVVKRQPPFFYSLRETGFCHSFVRTVCGNPSPGIRTHRTYRRIRCRYEGILAERRPRNHSDRFKKQGVIIRGHLGVIWVILCVI